MNETRATQKNQLCFASHMAVDLVSYFPAVICSFWLRVCVSVHRSYSIRKWSKLGRALGGWRGVRRGSLFRSPDQIHCVQPKVPEVVGSWAVAQFKTTPGSQQAVGGGIAFYVFAKELSMNPRFLQGFETRCPNGYSPFLCRCASESRGRYRMDEFLPFPQWRFGGFKQDDRMVQRTTESLNVMLCNAMHGVHHPHMWHRLLSWPDLPLP
ncbi:hypothetical protein BX600DRAFT_235548 [Xylariales sp. PMI_506]|nr:hypothetical protein BX600DRAFT_235548 [Xylariales sp. PMI_506]